MSQIIESQVEIRNVGELKELLRKFPDDQILMGSLGGVLLFHTIKDDETGEIEIEIEEL